MDTETGRKVGMLDLSSRLLVILLLVVVGTAATDCVDAQGRQNPVGFACKSRHLDVISYPKHPDVVSPDDKSGIHLTKDFSFREQENGAGG